MSTIQNADCMWVFIYIYPQPALFRFLPHQQSTCWSSPIVNSYFIKDGKVCLAGTHDELLQKRPRGAYYEHAQLQALSHWGRRRSLDVFGRCLSASLWLSARRNTYNKRLLSLTYQRAKNNNEEAVRTRTCIQPSQIAAILPKLNQVTASLSFIKSKMLAVFSTLY